MPSAEATCRFFSKCKHTVEAFAAVATAEPDLGPAWARGAPRPMHTRTRQKPGFRRYFWLALGSMVAGTRLAAAATSASVAGAAAAPAPPAPTAALQGAAAQAAELDKPLRGVSVQALVGGGYMVLDRKIAANPYFPQLTGRNELLGAGPSVQITLGLDVLQHWSLQLTGGMTLSGARRADYVHSLAQSFMALGVRFAVPIAERWQVNVAPSIAYVRQDNEVDPAQAGLGVMGQAGLEYYAHVRHFSMGADVSIQAPLTPTRVFIGVMPHVRYTF